MAVPTACRGKAHVVPSAAGRAAVVPANIAVGLALASLGKLRGNSHGGQEGWVTAGPAQLEVF